MKVPKTKLWCLCNIDIFSQLEEKELRSINNNITVKKIKKGDTLYLQGTSDKNVYILKKGAVKVTKLTPDGKTIIIDIFKDNTLFGEMSIVEPEERDETVEVIEDGHICIMSKEDFDTTLKAFPDISTKITKMMGLRRWKVENKLLDLLYSTVEQRIAKTIINLIDDFGLKTETGLTLKLKLTHQDLSDLIASTRETVTATLNHLKSVGAIDTEGKHITIKDLEKLKEIAES